MRFGLPTGKPTQKKDRRCGPRIKTITTNNSFYLIRKKFGNGPRG